MELAKEYQSSWTVRIVNEVVLMKEADVIYNYEENSSFLQFSSV